jgi:hypothetical protein
LTVCFVCDLIGTNIRGERITMKKEVIIKKEKLFNEYKRLTIEYVSEDNKLKDLISTNTNLSTGENITTWVLIPESLKKFDVQLKKVEKLLKRLREILDETANL